jgi:hypothetical protein
VKVDDGLDFTDPELVEELMTEQTHLREIVQEAFGNRMTCQKARDDAFINLLNDENTAVYLALYMDRALTKDSGKVKTSMNSELDWKKKMEDVI